MLYKRALVYLVRLLLLTGLTALAACTKAGNDELNWARAALERNPQIKVIGVDAAKNTIQVTVKASGETLTLTPGELAAIPIGDLLAHASAPPLVQADAMDATSPELVVEAVPPEATPIVEAPIAPEAAAKPEYTVQREDGQVRVTGPGVSIETHKPTAQETIATTKRFDEPIICDGKRMLHLDNRRINVAGDAIVARGGCELHITNSRIVATGTAITVLDATVHIVNSEISGIDGSLTNSSAARVVLRNSKFTGLARRDNQASIQDQGGNTWR